MSSWEQKLAFRHAPVLLQKAHRNYMRADCITNVDFAYGLKECYKNWNAVWERKGSGYLYSLGAHGYYSVVESHTHYFLLYAFYHPQDWSTWWGDPAKSSPSKLDQHLHDMEGCLAIVRKREHEDLEYVEALITISHYHFYSYAGWERSDGASLDYVSSWRLRDRTEDVDGQIQVTDRFKGGADEPRYRFKLHAASQSHAIRGDRKAWGDEKHIIRYRPSLTRADEPRLGGFKTEKTEKGVKLQTVRYKLISFFEKDGLWASRGSRFVFLPNKKGRETFVKEDDGELVSGSASPPWGWDDKDDRHLSGELAVDPAHSVYDYFGGLLDFSKEYMHNPYQGIFKS